MALVNGVHIDSSTVPCIHFILFIHSAHGMFLATGLCWKPHGQDLRHGLMLIVGWGSSTTEEIQAVFAR